MSLHFRYAKSNLTGAWSYHCVGSGYCDEAEFYDNDNGFVKVAEYRNGEIRPVGSFCPGWLKELLEV